MFPIDRNCEVINSEVLAIAHTDMRGGGSLQETAKDLMSMVVVVVTPY